MVEVQEAEMWAIYHPDMKQILYLWVRRTRKEAIDAFLKTYQRHEYETWKYWYRKGFRAVHVLVTTYQF